jgi:hypothetical protein
MFALQMTQLPCCVCHIGVRLTLGEALSIKAGSTDHKVICRPCLDEEVAKYRDAV